MSKLGRVVEAVENYNEHVLAEVQRARSDKKFGQEMVDRWNEVKRNIKTSQRNGSEVMVESGLQAGDRVVVYPSDALRDGGRIRAR